MPVALARDVVVRQDGQIQIDDLPVRVGEHVRVLIIPDHPIDTAADKYPLQ